MAQLAPITLTEGNDETVQVTLDRLFMSDDLLLITEVVFYLKESDCTSDAAALVLSSTDATEVNIVSQTSAQIVADVFIPASALQGAYPRFYRTDGLNAAGKRRTGPYGPVAVNDV